jgi:hypothetical protein
MSVTGFLHCQPKNKTGTLPGKKIITVVSPLLLATEQNNRTEECASSAAGWAGHATFTSALPPWPTPQAATPNRQVEEFKHGDARFSAMHAGMQGFGTGPTTERTRGSADKGLNIYCQTCLTMPSLITVVVVVVVVVVVKVVKVKSLCFNSAPRHEGILGEWRYSSTHSRPRH